MIAATSKNIEDAWESVQGLQELIIFSSIRAASRQPAAIQRWQWQAQL